MPLFIGDYLGDTMHLTPEQHGVYLLLIMACWRRGGLLPKDEAQLAGTARLTVKRWRKLLPVIAPFFLIADDGWRNKRVTQELDGAQKRINRAASGGAGKAIKQDLSSDQAGDKHVLEACSTAAPLPSPSSPPFQKDSEAHASAPMRPLDLDKAFWETGRAFLEANGVPHHRSGGLLGKWRKNHGREAVVAALARAEAESASDVTSFIEGCLKANGKRTDSNGRQSPHDTLVAGFGRAVARVQAGGG